MENKQTVQFRELEMQRRQVEQLEYLIGDAYDYLDRGLPTQDEREETWLNIKTWQERFELERDRLEQHVSRLRSSNPAIIECWVDTHQTILRRIKDRYTQSGSYQIPPEDVAILLADACIEKWERVRMGAHFYVYTFRSLMMWHEDLITEGFGF